MLNCSSVTGHHGSSLLSDGSRFYKLLCTVLGTFLKVWDSFKIKLICLYIYMRKALCTHGESGLGYFTTTFIFISASVSLIILSLLDKENSIEVVDCWF